VHLDHRDGYGDEHHEELRQPRLRYSTKQPDNGAYHGRNHYPSQVGVWSCWAHEQVKRERRKRWKKQAAQTLLTDDKGIDSRKDEDNRGESRKPPMPLLSYVCFSAREISQSSEKSSTRFGE
jgi:hypothetical protein